MHICDFWLPLPSHIESRIYGHMAIEQGDDTFVGIQHILDLKVHNGLFHLKRQICKHHVSKNSRCNDLRLSSTCCSFGWRPACLPCAQTLLLESMHNRNECKSQTKTTAVEVGLKRKRTWFCVAHLACLF